MLGIKKGAWLEDYYRVGHYVDSEEKLQALHNLFESQRLDRAKEQLSKLNPTANIEMEPDNYVDWLVKRDICPHALVTNNSRYHFENIILLDTEMGLTLPDPQKSIGQTPAIFWQALGIVRTARASIKDEDQEKKKILNG